MPFRDILSAVLRRHPAVLALAFSDDEGELVQLVQRDGDVTDPFELQVLAATPAAWVHAVARVSASDSEQLRVQISTARHHLLVQGLPDGYYLTALVKRPASRAVVAQALIATARDTARQM